MLVLAARKLLAEDPAQSPFERLLPIGDVFPEREVDERLVVAAPRGVDSLAKPGEHVVVEANGDAGLSRGNRQNTAPLTPAEVVLLLHGYMYKCTY